MDDVIYAPRDYQPEHENLFVTAGTSFYLATHLTRSLPKNGKACLLGVA